MTSSLSTVAYRRQVSVVILIAVGIAICAAFSVFMLGMYPEISLKGQWAGVCYAWMTLFLGHLAVRGHYSVTFGTDGLKLRSIAGQQFIFWRDVHSVWFKEKSKQDAGKVVFVEHSAGFAHFIQDGHRPTKPEMLDVIREHWSQDIPQRSHLAQPAHDYSLWRRRLFAITLLCIGLLMAAYLGDLLQGRWSAMQVCVLPLPMFLLGNFIINRIREGTEARQRRLEELEANGAKGLVSDEQRREGVTEAFRRIGHWAWYMFRFYLGLFIVVCIIIFLFR